LLKNNGNVRGFLLAKYLDYRVAVTRLQNSDEWGQLSAEVRQDVSSQNKLFNELSDAKKNAIFSWGATSDAFIDGKNAEDILAIPKGSRPEPSDYLKINYIESHLSNFKTKASYLVTADTYNKYIVGSATVGRPDGLFISTKSDIDALLLKANGDINIIEHDLGIPKGNWQGKGGIYRIDIIEPERFNLRLPSGNEDGVNDLWLPGGKLPDGKLEAVTDPVPLVNIIPYKVIN